MSTAAKTIAALLFVALLVAVLTIPLRNFEPRSESRRVAVSPSPEPSPSATRSARGSPQLLERLPRWCRSWRHSAPADDGVVAAYHRGRVALATPGGDLVAKFRATAPVGWSVTGRYLATGSRGWLWDLEGAPVERHGEYQMALGGRSGGRISSWAWSPVRDCAYVMDRQGSLFATVVDTSKIPPVYSVTLASDVEDFVVSSDWRWLGLVLRDPGWRSLAIADLKKNRIDVVKTFTRETCCITLAGLGSMRDLLYWAAPGTSVSADGWPLKAISTRGQLPLWIWRSILPDPDFVGDCAGTGTVIAGGNRDRRTNKHLRHIEGSSARLTPPGLAVSGFTCSPASTLVFSAARDGAEPIERKLYIYELAGAGGIRVLADDPDRADDHPEWAPGSGVLFVRWAGNQGRLWLLPEGGEPRALPLTVRTNDGAYWGGAEWDRVIDWSATPPDGLPAG